MSGKSIFHLSNLVPELLDTIFCKIISLRDLDNFISTCGFIHRYFQERKRHIVFRVLQNELGPALTDAMFLHQFPVMKYLSTQSYTDKLHEAAALYRRMLRDARHGGRRNLPSWATIEQLCRTFHRMRLLTKVYLILHMQKFATQGDYFWHLSRVERWRILKAFYRRQIICNAWKPIHLYPSWTQAEMAAFSNTNKNGQAPLGLLATFEPWELQQIDHIDFFVTRFCRALCQSEWEALRSPYIPMSSQSLDESYFLPDIGSNFFNADHLARYLRRHPAIADAAFRKLPFLMQLDTVEIDSYCGATHSLSPYHLRCLYPAWQLCSFRIHEVPATDSPEKEYESGNSDSNNREIEFAGDDADLVPFAWVDALSGRHMHWFGCMVASFPHVAEQLYPNRDDTSVTEAQRMVRSESTRIWRMTGFALWDRERVEALKELDRFESFQTGWIGSEDITPHSRSPLVELPDDTNS